MSEKLWKGRLQGATDAVVERFTASIDRDRRLYRHDIQGSIAHCRMLARVGVITAEEAERLVGGLEAVGREIESGKFVFDPALEDIHMHIEARLQALVGEVARKLHTARSRNDQVALDLRLFLREALVRLEGRLLDFQQVLVGLAERHMDVLLPGYTHLQRAQPVRLAHHLMAYFEMAERDAARMADCRRRANVLPLGAAALAGTTYPIDRRFVAEQLGFEEVSANSLDAVGDRDFIIEFLAAASICMVHLSRLAEELVLWSTVEFGFLELPDAFTTGSSIMPQKKNPDVAELVRGKAGGVFGHLVAMLATMKGLPLAYNRDLQEDKAPLFDAVDTLEDCLEVFTAMLPKINVRAERMRQAAATGYQNATDLADYLVSRGMPFRQAHHAAGLAVRRALATNRELHEMSLEELKACSTLVADDVFDWLSLERVVDRRATEGATGRGPVAAAIERAKASIERRRAALQSARGRL